MRKHLLLLVSVFIFSSQLHAQSYQGQWTNDSLFLEITSDSVIYYQFMASGCYTINAFAYTDQGNNVLGLDLDGQQIPISVSLSSNDSILSVISFDTTVFNLNNFDISQYNPCVSAWTCSLDGCFEAPSGQYETQAECIAACDTSSGGGTNYSYLDMWYYK